MNSPNPSGSRQFMKEDSAISVSIQSLLDERHALRERTLQQPSGSGTWMGNFRGARRGQGTDFDDLRHYSAGDDVRHIDWKASARTNHLHTRLYREEREHRVTVIADIRSIMFTGSQELRAVTACRLSARLLWQAVEGGSRVSVILVDDTGVALSKVDGGHRAAIDCCGLLARRFALARQRVQLDVLKHEGHSQFGDDLTTKDHFITLAVQGTGESSRVLTLSETSHWLLMQRQLQGAMIWVSGFDFTGDNFDNNLSVLSEATDQIAVHVDEPMLDTGLPPGRYGYRRAHTENYNRQSTNVNSRNREQLLMLLRDARQLRAKRFENLNIPLLGTAHGIADVVANLRQGGYLP